MSLLHPVFIIPNDEDKEENQRLESCVKQTCLLDDYVTFITYTKLYLTFQNTQKAQPTL